MRHFPDGVASCGGREVRDGSHVARFGEEFFAPLPLLSVGLFALNNFSFKQAWPGFVTGKLSDVTACFFLPLFVSALLDLASRRRLRWRLRIGLGVLLTALVFVSVKLDADASRLLDGAVNAIGAPLGLPASVNHADRSDLLALTFLALSVLFALRIERQRERRG